MSSPVHQGTNLDGVIKYAPPWARDDARHATLVPETGKIEWPPRGRRAGTGGGAFSGDVAVRELQRQVGLQPEKVPEPVKLERSRGRLALRICAAMGAAAIAAGAIVMWPMVRSGANAEAIGAAIMALVVGGGKQDHLSVATEPHLFLRDEHGETNETLPVGIEIDGNRAGASLVLSGLAADTQLSAGSPLGASGWRVDAADLEGLEIRPPRNFVGAMNIMVDLRLPDDRLADTKAMHLEWAARTEAAAEPQAPAEPKAQAQSEPEPQAQPEPQPVALHLDPAEIATLLKRGQEYLKNGDLVSARLLLKRAAAAGSADGAFALAQTFDPVVVTRIGVIGVSPNAEKAREWYQKAAQLGSGLATQQLANFEPKTE
jgi:Sel1 repeat-containing protein